MGGHLSDPPLLTLNKRIKNKRIVVTIIICEQVEQRKNGEQLFSHSTETQNGGGNSQQGEFRLNVRINFLIMRVSKC